MAHGWRYRLQVSTRSFFLMHQDLISFAKKYRRLLGIFSFWVALAPGLWRPGLVFAMGRWLSPFHVFGEKIRRSIGLAFAEDRVQAIWRDWLNSHVQFVLDFLSYKRLNKTWLAREVVIEDPAALAALRDSGGLLLTYHMHHQNTLCCALGLGGVKVSAIAALPEDSPLFPLIGRWAQRVNADSAMHFEGGSYIFTNNLRVLLRSTRKVLAEGDVLVCLCDFHQPKPGIQPGARFFDRFISPPTGTIEVAVKHGAPVYAAMFAPLNGRLVLKLKRLDESGGVEAIVAGYFSFLEVNIRTNPACWQGWEWFEDLPLAE